MGDGMLEVNFYEEVEDRLLKFAVICARSNKKWVYCKHKERNTYEVPGGHREPGENILVTAERELREETGASDFDLKPVSIYSVKRMEEGMDEEETFGLLCFAEIHSFAVLPDYEMEKVILCMGAPAELTYPLIQPKLLEKVVKYLNSL
jgi:8-oxo-dGTP pyrophosphatase MutT (NUDIX family)